MKAVSSDKEFYEKTARSFGNILNLGASGNWAWVEVVRRAGGLGEPARRSRRLARHAPVE